VAAYEPCCRGEQRHCALLAALSGDAHEWRPIEAEVGRAKVQKLLDARGRVVQEREDKVIATPLWGAAIWASQIAVSSFAVRWQEVAGTSERDGEDLLRRPAAGSWLDT
jgi:hypothetical protein